MQPDAIKYITIRSFRSIASVEKLELGPINVLIGANGAGKSNFVEAFVFIDEALDERLERLGNYVKAAGGAEKLLHFGSKTTKEIVLQLFFEGGEFLESTLSPAVGDSLYLREAQFRNQRPRSNSGPWRVYHLHDTSPMRDPPALPGRQ